MPQTPWGFEVGPDVPGPAEGLPVAFCIQCFLGWYPATVRDLRRELRHCPQCTGPLLPFGSVHLDSTPDFCSIVRAKALLDRSGVTVVFFPDLAPEEKRAFVDHVLKKESVAEAQRHLRKLMYGDGYRDGYGDGRSA